MSPYFWTVAVVFVLALAIWSRRSSSIPRLAKRAAETGDLGPLLETLTTRRAAAQPTGFNQAIRLLWEMDERRLAVALVKELASRHGEVRIAQYWLREALTTEPAIAARVLSREFVTEHFQPEVAAQCGPVG